MPAAPPAAAAHVAIAGVVISRQNGARSALALRANAGFVSRVGALRRARRGALGTVRMRALKTAQIRVGTYRHDGLDPILRRNK
eukprot:6210847-Pleurochrysis_carterae.AAC.1